MKTLFLALVIAAPTAATPIIDQEALPSNGSASIYGTRTTRQQEVIAGMDGLLVAVDYFFPQGGAAADSRHRFGINLGELWQWDEDDWTSVQTIDFPFDFLNGRHVDVSSAGIVLQAGDHFSLTWMGFNASSGGSLSMTAGYPGNMAFRNIAEQGFPVLSGSDIGFRTWMEPIVGVPEPAGVILLLIGLLPISFGLRLTR